ncbi:MAG: acyl-CoA dehydrogenase family protein [Mycobacterium leprae]
MTARLVAYHAVHLLHHGLACDAELKNAKYVNVEFGLDSARTAMEVDAACGLLTDRPVERYLRACAMPTTSSHRRGPSDVRLLRLAEMALRTSKGEWSKRFADLTATATGEFTYAPAASSQSLYETPCPGKHRRDTMTTPSRMRVATQHSFGDRDVLVVAERPAHPSPCRTEIRMRVVAAGINRRGADAGGRRRAASREMAGRRRGRVLRRFV